MADCPQENAALASVSPSPSRHEPQHSLNNRQQEPPSSVLAALARPHLYLDSLLTIAIILRQSVITGCIAFAVNVVFTLGFFWKGQAPKDQSFQAFMAATMCYVCVFMASSMLLGFSASLAKYRWIRRPDAPLSNAFWFVRLFIATCPHFVVSAAVVSAIGYASASVNHKWTPYQMHFYVSGLIINYYTATLDVFSHKLFQTETVEGVRLGYVNRSLLWKRIVKAYRKDFGFVIAVYTASGYIHLSTLLQPRTQNELLLFSVFSLAIRFTILKITRHFVLKHKKIDLRQLYVAAAVPTVMINTQIRVALLNVQANVSLTGVVIVGLMEPLMRISKVYFLRREINRSVWDSRTHRPILLLADGLRAQRFKVSLSRPQASSAASRGRISARSPSPFVTKRVSPSTAPGVSHIPPPSTQTEAERCRQARQRLLQFTSAEIHADMCSEYIAIACSMSIYYCLSDHPKFAWSGHGTANSSDPTHPAKSQSRVELVVVQLLIEIAVDLLCCVWELANGIPLRATSGLGSFLVVVFTGCAIANVAVCCAFYMRDS